MRLSEEEWRKRLSPQQYKILREGETEAPFSGELLNVKGDGSFVCAACGAILFSSDHKFDSGTGWPSFFDVASSDAVEFADDNSHGVHRIEARCSSCGSHLGHVFDDGPADKTGKRYCINSACLGFEPKTK